MLQCEFVGNFSKDGRKVKLTFSYCAVDMSHAYKLASSYIKTSIEKGLRLEDFTIETRGEDIAFSL